MDSDSWISSLAAAKRHQISQLDRLGMDDLEVEEETRPFFACPYCYEDHDVTSLCNHLEDEHSFESKIAVCPICSVNVARDMLSHITLQHRHLFKMQRCRRLHRVAIPNSLALSLLGWNIHEAHLQVLLRSGRYQSSNTTMSTAVTDSLLSSLCLNFLSSEVEDTQKSTFSTAESLSIKKRTLLQTWKSSIDHSLSHEERERKRKQATVRATFMQDMLLYTLIGD